VQNLNNRLFVIGLILVLAFFGASAPVFGQDGRVAERNPTPAGEPPPSERSSSAETSSRLSLYRDQFLAPGTTISGDSTEEHFPSITEIFVGTGLVRSLDERDERPSKAYFGTLQITYRPENWALLTDGIDRRRLFLSAALHARVEGAIFEDEAANAVDSGFRGNLTRGFVGVKLDIADVRPDDDHVIDTDSPISLWSASLGMMVGYGFQRGASTDGNPFELDGEHAVYTNIELQARTSALSISLAPPFEGSRNGRAVTLLRRIGDLEMRGQALVALDVRRESNARQLGFRNEPSKANEFTLQLGVGYRDYHRWFDLSSSDLEFSLTAIVKARWHYANGFRTIDADDMTSQFGLGGALRVEVAVGWEMMLEGVYFRQNDTQESEIQLIWGLNGQF
jgi:hypothetical protein